MKYAMKLTYRETIFADVKFKKKVPFLYTRIPQGSKYFEEVFQKKETIHIFSHCWSVSPSVSKPVFHDFLKTYNFKIS